MSVGPMTLDHETMKLLASDTRLAILKALDERQRTVTELGRALDLNKATVFEHLEKLGNAGLVQRLEGDRKWVYWQLTWRGRRLLHPGKMGFALMLSSSLAAVLVAAVAYWVHARWVVAEAFAGDNAGDRAADAPDAETTGDAAPTFSWDGTDPAATGGPEWLLTLATVALVGAVLLLAAAGILRRRAQQAAASSP